MKRGAGGAGCYPHGMIPFPALRAAGDDTERGDGLSREATGNDNDGLKAKAFQ